MAVSALAQDDFASLMKRGDKLDAQLKTKEALEVYLQAEKLDRTTRSFFSALRSNTANRRMTFRPRKRSERLG
jgi:hypothetical protein